MAESDLTTLAHVKRSLRIAETNATHDADLIDYLAAATPVIEDMTGPIITGTHTATRDGGRIAVLLPSSIQSVTSVAENGTEITDYVADKQAGIVFAGDRLAPRAFFPGRQNIVITYTGGEYATTTDVPANIAMAARELVRFWWQVGQQGSRPAYGDEDDDAVFTPSGFAVPRRVSELCASHPRMPGFA